MIFIKFQFEHKLFFKTLENISKRVYHINNIVRLRNDEYPKPVNYSFFVKKEVYHG